MAIAFDNVSTSTSNSRSYTATGTDLVMALACLTGAETTLTATYNGTSLTHKGYVVLSGAGNNLHLLALDDPSTGANTLSIGAASIENTCITYSGANSTANFGTNTNSAASITISVTIGTSNSWMLTAATGRTGPHALTASTGVSNDRTSGASYIGFGDSGPLSTGSNSHTWNNGASLENAALAIEITPVSAGATATPTCMLMGVGT